MNKKSIEKEILTTKVNGEKEETPMGPFYKITDGTDYTEDMIYELKNLNTGTIQAHQEAIEILTSYNIALSEKTELLQKEKEINDTVGLFYFLSKITLEHLVAEFYWCVVEDEGLLYRMEYLEETIRIIDAHFELDEETVNNIIKILGGHWEMKTTELDKTIIRIIASEDGSHNMEYYKQKSKAVKHIN